MTMISAAFLLLSAPPALPAMLPVTQHRRGDHDDALHARKQGRLLPVGEIERRIVPQMRGAKYIGFDFDAGSAVYTLKFLREGHVIWVSVDGRSGAVIGRAGG